jgi:hypothetical protein
MSKADEYRQFANDCIVWARIATSDDQREQFLELAKKWMSDAESIFIPITSYAKLSARRKVSTWDFNWWKCAVPEISRPPSALSRFSVRGLRRVQQYGHHQYGLRPQRFRQQDPPGHVDRREIRRYRLRTTGT